MFFEQSIDFNKLPSALPFIKAYLFSFLVAPPFDLMHKMSIVPERMRKWGLGVDYDHHIGMSSSNLFTFRRSCKTFHQSFMSLRHRTDVQLASSFQYNAVLSHLENNTTFAQWVSQPFLLFSEYCIIIFEQKFDRSCQCASIVYGKSLSFIMCTHSQWIF